MKLYSVMTGTCPQCQEGKCFVKDNAYWKKGLVMHDNCPNCGHRFEIETGFFYGSMYVSYAIGIAVMVAGAVGVYSLTQSSDVAPYLITLPALVVVFAPLNYKVARMVWMNLFTPYGGKER